MDASYELFNFLTHIKEKYELIRILEERDGWKMLMANLPKTVKLNDYNCDITSLAYNSLHVRQVEDTSAKTKQKCSEIMLTDWSEPLEGDFPCLGHLLDVLTKSELYRAAVYVAVTLLKQEPPKRPEKGPVAQVTLNPDEDLDTDIEEVLEAMNYSSSAIMQCNNSRSINTNLNYTSPNVPEIIISESPYEPDGELPNLSILMGDSGRTNNQTEISDMMKFTTNSIVESSLSNESTESNILSRFKSDTQEYRSEEQESHADNIPAFSLLLNAVEISPPVLKQNQSNNNKQFLSSHNSKSRQTSSPLPNISFNTVLPHFSYTELEFATDNFNKSSLSESGRFLGAGTFGEVYLAVALPTINKPVAVKKLTLNSNIVLTEDSPITKQFRNEVEILYKYKHENLLSIIGYSCDGPTYCLLYEYIPGGALKERLQSSEKLIWTERLYIALGTAKAISYLHTAFDTALIHRDIKSANILLDLTNKPKLGDFGLIKLLSNQDDITGTIWGTTVYMAPEALRGGEMSVQMDSFSFGVVLLELLTSLSVVDSNRSQSYLVHYMEETCPENIDSLLDKSIGSWKAETTDFGQEIYIIARQCLKHVKERPNMEEVTRQLTNLVQKFV